MWVASRATGGGGSLLLKKVPGLAMMRGEGSVRFYARKPRWVPIAKSKMYTIRELPYQPPHEEQEMARLTNNYQLYCNSLWEFQRQESEKEEAISQSVTDEGSEEAEWGRIVAEIERENALVESVRDKERVLEWKRLEEEIEADKASQDQKALQEMAVTEEKMKKQLERLKSIITADNLDQAIEAALAVEVDYHYAIDKSGQVYPGRLSDEAIPVSSVVDLQGIQVKTSSSSPQASTSKS